jgi:hypothetical protein
MCWEATPTPRSIISGLLLLFRLIQSNLKREVCLKKDKKINEKWMNNSNDKEGYTLTMSHYPSTIHSKVPLDSELDCSGTVQPLLQYLALLPVSQLNRLAPRVMGLADTVHNMYLTRLCCRKKWGLGRKWDLERLKPSSALELSEEVRTGDEVRSWKAEANRPCFNWHLLPDKTRHWAKSSNFLGLD